MEIFLWSEEPDVFLEALVIYMLVSHNVTYIFKNPPLIN